MIGLSVINPELLSIVLISVIIIAIGGILRYVRQPYVIAYILAGVLIGKHGFEIVTDEEAIRAISEFGLILLLFFIGMEISLPEFIKNWKVPTLGTLIQIIGSILMIGLIGYFFNWSMNRIIVLGFIISLSSSAVVIKLLQDNKESNTAIGQCVISILLTQDILIVPMLILTSYFGGTAPSTQEIILQLLGGLLLISVIIWVIRKKEFTLPFSNTLKDDHEMQVFVAIIFCFGFAILTAFFGISAALGAFVGGMVVHAARSTEWFHDSLHSFRVIFVAIFFASVGMLIDISFLISNWKIISLIIIAVLVGNHFINSVVIYFFGRNWKMSLYGGALLAQIGELSFVLASTAYYAEIISDFEYKLTIIVISLTLLISPFWISITKKLLGIRNVTNSNAVINKYNDNN
ncbi:MAG: cation:proton antiporter [Eudoraea sp.]|nr:cation:proton antiporter [Eudoraea sp.]NNK70669.1 cation:proton antiporter [Flavobacteriaceae bacterium]